MIPFQRIFSAHFTQILALILLIGCAGDEDSKNNELQTQSVRKNFDIGRCDQSPFDGEDFDRQSFKGSVANSGYFDKKLSFRPIETSLDASSASIVEGLQQQGVYLYHVEVPSQSECFYFDYLHPAPESSIEQWNKLGGSSLFSSLLGLFSTFYNRSSNGAVSISSPTILLRRDTQKWTLIHEMIHFLYAHGRTKESNWRFRSELEKEVTSAHQRARNLKNKYRAKPSATLGLKTFEEFEVFFNINLELDKRGPLEELSIESILIDLADQDLIAGIDINLELRNALAYLRANRNEVVPSYKRLLKELRNIDVENFHRAQQKKRALVSKVQSTLHFIAEKLEAAEDAYNRNQPINLSAQPRLAPQVHRGHHYDVKKLRERHKLFYQW